MKARLGRFLVKFLTYLLAPAAIVAAGVLVSYGVFWLLTHINVDTMIAVLVLGGLLLVTGSVAWENSR